MPGADCCLVNSGTFRSDCINQAGIDFTLGDLKKCKLNAFNMYMLFNITFFIRSVLLVIPFADQIVMIQCKGKDIHEALENSVSMYPKLEGRFSQIAGIKFAFDSNEPPNQRIDPKSIQIKGTQLDLTKVFCFFFKYLNI